MNLLEVNQICKTYGSGEAAVYALKNVSFSLLTGCCLMRLIACK